MSQISADIPTLPHVRPRPPRKRPSVVTILCWLILLAIAIALPLLRAENSSSQAAGAGATPATAPATSQPVVAEAVDFQTEVIGKYIVGTASLSKASGSELISQMDTRAITPDQKLVTGIVAIELSDRDGGLKRIDQSDSPDRAEFASFYRDHTPLSAETIGRYGFFGRLAESDGMSPTAGPRTAVINEALRIVYLSATVFVLLLLLTLVGFTLLVTGVVLAALGKIRTRVDPPHGPSQVYIEAFTVYIGGFVAGSLLLQWLKPDAPLAIHGVMMVGVVVLGIIWPRLRGVPWSQQRLDWGLYVGNPIVEIFMGALGYIAGLPVVAVGMLVTLLLMQQTHSTASHPIVQQVATHPYLVLLLASVFAPLTEETLFRGAMLSHLRAGVGPVLAGVITGLMFASVHPQGWAAIPALGSIGFVLAMIRQWRGSLLGSMTAHALNNTFVMILVMMMS